MQQDIHQKQLKLEQLNREAETWEGKCEGVQRELADKAKRQKLLKLAELVRKPRKEFSLWPIGLIVVTTAVMGCLGFCGSYALGFSTSSTVIISGLMAALGSVPISFLLFRPNDQQLVASLDKVSSEISYLETESEVCQERARAFKQQAQAVHLELKQIYESGIIQRRSLLAKDWKAMRSTEFERYLEEVFSALGQKVHHIGSAGDQGVDLVVLANGMKVAVQVKGYFNSVNNKAVQEVFSGMRHHGCQRCAVITNSRFTKSTIELAESVGCKLISENELPSLVMGEYSL